MIAHPSFKQPACPRPTHRGSQKRGLLSTAQVLPSLLLLLSIALLGGCQQQAKATNQVPAVEAYPVALPKVSDAVIEREYVAEIRATRYAEVRARRKGIIEVVAVDEGESVERGQQLFSIGAHDLELELAAAEAAALAARAQLEAARLDVKNTQLLFDKDIVSKAELALSKAKARTLEAKLRQLEAAAERVAVEVGYSRVEAPFQGTVDEIPNNMGSAIAAGQLLTTVANASEVYAYFRLSEREYLAHKSELESEQRTEVWLKLADGRLFPRPGRVDAVANEFDRETGSIMVRATFQNQSGVLKHGSSGKIVFKTRLPQALLVPQESTFEVQGSVFVYAVDAGDIVRARRIVPKLRLGEDFVIESGLAASDRFVLEGSQELREGAKIQVLPSGVAAKEG